MQIRAVNGTGGQGAVQVNVGGAGVKREGVISSYEQKLGTARRWARTIGLIHGCSRFVALCNLIWATVVLLGAFASSLNRRDFVFVASLLLLEAGRLASAASCSRLLTRPLARLSQDPSLIDHPRDPQYLRARRIRLFSQLLQLLFISPSFIIPLLAFFHVSLQTYPDSQDTHNLYLSLLIFYSLVSINSVVALIHLACIAMATRPLSEGSSEQSVARFFDKVVDNAISSGVVKADEFEFMCFAYRMLADEFARNVQPEAVTRNHKELIKYLYAHRLGVDSLLIYLDAEDVFLRLAAANMVGFWANKSWGTGVEDELTLPEKLLTKLADRMGTEQVGWAAVNSVGALARRPEGARLIQSTHTTRGKPLADRLVDLIDPGSSRSLSIVRSLVSLYEQLSVDMQQPPAPFADPETRLVPKLRALAARAKRHRLRVQAAYLLLIMGFGHDPVVISAIQPASDDYWFESEVRMLELLQILIDVRPDTKYPRIVKDGDIRPPPWAL